MDSMESVYPLVENIPQLSISSFHLLLLFGFEMSILDFHMSIIDFHMSIFDFHLSQIQVLNRYQTLISDLIDYSLFL